MPNAAAKAKAPPAMTSQRYCSQQDFANSSAAVHAVPTAAAPPQPAWPWPGRESAGLTEP